MPQPFNSPKHAIAFLKSRGIFDKMLTKEAGYYRVFVGLKRRHQDFHEARAIIYLARHDHPCALAGFRYEP